MLSITIACEKIKEYRNHFSMDTQMGIVKPIYPHNFVDGSRGGEFKTKNLLGKTELVENFLPTAKRNVVQQVKQPLKMP